ncbi:MAG: hypothetical protein WDA74_00530 [Spirochaetota bacterium]
MKRLFVVLTLLLFFSACGTSVLPEMKDFMSAFGSKEKVAVVVEKYAADSEIVPKALEICELGTPNITNTEKKDGMVLYTAEAVVEDCESSETAVGTIRIFDIGWKDGKIVSFEWQGPKGGAVEY